MPPPIPQAICDRAELLCRVHDQKTVAEILGICEDLVGDIKRRGWKAVPPGRRMRPRPSDFAIQSRCMTQRELAQHYRTGPDIVARWRREVGQ